MGADQSSFPYGRSSFRPFLLMRASEQRGAATEGRPYRSIFLVNLGLGYLFGRKPTPELAVEPSPVMVKGPAPVLLRKIPRVGPLAPVPVLTLLNLNPFAPMVELDTNTAPPVLDVITLGELVLSEVS